MNNKKKGTVACIVSFIVIAVFVLQVNASTYNLNVTKYSQEKSNWCWAACAKMVGKYYGYNLSQSAICIYVKGSAVNEAASLSEVTKAIGYASKKIISQSGIAQSQAFSINIKANKPCVLRIGWNSGGGHVYVISGIQEGVPFDDTYLYMIDPISGNSSGYYAYSSLVNGTTLKAGTGKYTHTWWVS